MRNKSGFSAIELIVAIVVIAIVIGGAYMIFSTKPVTEPVPSATPSPVVRSNPTTTSVPVLTDVLEPTSASLPSSTPTVIVNGAEARDIGYILPEGWIADLEGSNDQNNDLFIYPTEGGGFIAINVYDYDSSVSEKDYYCQVTVDYCIDGVSTFESTTIGNLDGYQAVSVDNSGGGAEYFGARFDKFYTISTFSPPDAEAEYNLNGATVFDSLRF